MRGSRATRSIVLLLLAAGGVLRAGASPETAEEHAARAASCWNRRAEGWREGRRPDAAIASCAVAEWRAARRAAPQRLDWAAHEIEALWFLAHFATPDRAARRALLDRAVLLADETIRRAPPDERTAVGTAHFWAAIAWGEWGLEHGWLASAGRGVAGRLREHAEAAERWVPEIRDGGGWRLLGRLHATLPRIPLVTGWVDRERGRALLRRAWSYAPDDPRNVLFLAEALLEGTARERDEGRRLLVELAAREPRAGELVEESETLAQARRRLAEQVDRGDR